MRYRQLLGGIKLLLLLSLTLGLGPFEAKGLEYEYCDLGTLGGNKSFAFAINNAGAVTGSTQSTSGYQAFLWKDGSMLALDPLSNAGYGINELNEVAGSLIRFNPSFEINASFWNPLNGLQELTSANVHGVCEGRDVNNSGFVSIHCDAGLAYRWDGSNLTQLALGMFNTQGASAIDDLGRVYGHLAAIGADERPVRWDSPTVIKLGGFPAALFTGGVIDAANDDGSFSVGRVFPISGPQSRAAIWGNNVSFVMTLDNPHGPNEANFALGVNNAGDVVGTNSMGTTSRAFVYSAGVMEELDDIVLPSPVGVQFTSANDIDDSLRITGVMRNSNGHSRGYVAHPKEQFIRGDVNSDGSINIGDVISILAFLFQNGADPDPMDGADVDDGGSVDIADSVLLLSYLFSPPGTVIIPGNGQPGLDGTHDCLI